MGGGSTPRPPRGCWRPEGAAGRAAGSGRGEGAVWEHPGSCGHLQTWSSILSGLRRRMLAGTVLSISSSTLCKEATARRC